MSLRALGEPIIASHHSVRPAQLLPYCGLYFRYGQSREAVRDTFGSTRLFLPIHANTRGKKDFVRDPDRSPRAGIVIFPKQRNRGQSHRHGEVQHT